MGSMGDYFTLDSFLFRFLFGLILNGIYVTRGFGVAAWTHALYDVIVVTFFKTVNKFFSFLTHSIYHTT